MAQRADRPSARVIVVDEAGHVLLIRVEDARGNSPPVWITPGGGIEAEESLTRAAARELFEETGLSVSPADLGNPIAACRGEWEFRGQPLYSVDWFFLLRTKRFDVAVGGWTDLERELHAAWRWWTADELDSTEEAVLPCGLAGLVRQIGADELPAEPIELPWLAI